MKTILITGASGLIGTHLTSLLQSKGYRVLHLGRKASGKNGIPAFVWNVQKHLIDDNAIEQADVIVHLAGAGIADEKWTDDRKKEIIISRTESAKLISESMKRVNKKPSAFITASAIGYYGAVTSDHEFTENDHAANDFVGHCCKLWEESANPFSNENIRTVKIRVGVVLAKEGGALPKMTAPVKLGIGSGLGTGKQFVPWIHIDDICGIFLKAIEDESMNGIYNGVAPEATTNFELTRSISKTLHKPFFMPNVPGFVLKIIFGKRAALFLEGSRVSSAKIEKKGFVFKYRNVKDALEDLLH